MMAKRQTLREQTQFRILRLLQDNPEMSQRDLAHTLGVSLGSVNYCLQALVQKGLLKFSNFAVSEDKRRYAYVLTPKGLAKRAALTAGFLRRKLAEYEALKREIASLEAEMTQIQPYATTGQTARIKDHDD